ncbi:MAG: Ribosomal protein [Chlorobi bacterium]|nr:Ribosomal protein [Chlorobiota bacterium]
MRLVIDLIRGKNAAVALGILRFSANHASHDAELALRSATANLLQKDDRIDPDTVVVKEVFVNQGTTMKRMLPAPMGRAYRMRKRSNHLTIIVAGTTKK